MALKTDIRGMVWHYPDHFVVGREQIRQYARAVKADDPGSHDEDAAAELGHEAIVAPLTFSAIFALLVQQHFFRHVDIGMETMQIVQVDQKFVYKRPVVAGDRLWCHFDIVSVQERFGADIVVSKNTCIHDDGDIVMEAYTTLMGQQGENSAKIDFL